MDYETPVGTKSYIHCGHDPALRKYNGKCARELDESCEFFQEGAPFVKHLIAKREREAEMEGARHEH